MKRFTLKHVLAIFMVLGLSAFYLLSCFTLLNITVFRWEDGKKSQGSGSQISGNTSGSANTYKSNNDIITFNFENPVNPEISDYILVSITAKNTGLAKYPYGSIAVNLSEEKMDRLNSSAPGATDSNTGINIAGSPGIYRIQERTRIFVDGIRHNYYIAVGENTYWRYDWNLDGPTLKGKISSLEIEIPKIEGVSIQINSISLNQRTVFALDSHINYFFKNYFQLSHIARYLTPAYVFLILFTVVFFPLSFLLKRTSTGGARGARISYKTLVLLIPLFLLIVFSFYFINNYIFTVKSYWDSYKQYIISGRLDETYHGFSDFEKFVTWVGEKVPQDRNVIVLVKGEPVYIMAQMAYGLYPRDVKFMDISNMSVDEIADKITSFNFIYEYIVVLSETDKVFLESVKVKLEYSYRENAGFIYKTILK